MTILHKKQIRKGRGRQEWSSKWIKTATIMAAIASSQLIPNVVNASEIPVGGMVPHLLEHGSNSTSSSILSSSSIIATTADSQATIEATKQSAKLNASEEVLSAFSQDGAPHSSLVSEAVSLAGTSAGTKTDDPSDKSAGYTRKASEKTKSSSDNKGKPTPSNENRAAFPQVTSKSDFTSSTNSPSVSSASQSSTTPAPDQRTASWHYWGGALGCDQGSASGTAYVCHATGVPVPGKRSIQDPKERAAVEMDEAFENIMDKRQSSDSEGDDPSGNGGPPLDILNKDSPDIGWLDVIVGAVPYKNGDLAPSIVWILATLILFPLFVIRLFRRSSLIAHVLLTVFIWGCVMIATFAIRASLANKTPKSTLMNVQNITLQILPCLLIEPLLNLLALYAQQGGFPTGVPRVALFLRLLNLIALLLYVVGAAYLANWISGWDAALQDNQQIGDRSNFPNSIPDSISRIGPIVGSFMQVVCILGALILIPIARGENGSMRPGGFIAVLVILITIPVVYRVLQTLHAQGEINSETGGDSNPFKVLAKNGASMSSAAMNAVMNLVPVAAIAPPGMYNSDVSGIDWSQLQQTLASRSNIQSPLVFNLVYIFPQWLMVFFFFFVHAPGRENDGKLAAASAQP